MPTPFIVLVDAPAGEPGAVLEVLERRVESNNLSWRQVFGHGDFDEFGYKNLAQLEFQTYRRRRYVLALDREVGPLDTSPEGFPVVRPDTHLAGARVLGSTLVSRESEHNPHLLDEIEITVRPDWQRQGVGSALQTALEDLASAWGCTTLGGYSTHEGEQTGDLVMPAEGPFGVRRDAGTRFALKHGYHLAQGERHSVQQLPEDPRQLAAPDLAEGYGLVSWSGTMAPSLADGMARLVTAFESSVPLGELDYRPQVVTAQRMLDNDRQAHRFNDSVTVAARHRDTGDLVGYTQLVAAPEQPEPAWQGITVVLPEHRGHRLGLAIKHAAIRDAAARWPRLRRVHTWNAGENDYMWAVNEALGYRTAGVAGAWQKKLG